MLVKEIIQRIQSLYSKGVQSSDSRLTARHIFNKVLTVRTKLLSQQSAKKQKISDWNYQTISCVELIEIPPHQCPCISPLGCELVRSKFKLPKPIMNLSNHIIKNVSSIDGSVRYSEITLSEKKYKSGNKYTANKPDYFIQDGFLYLTHKKGTPRVVMLTGLFEDPIQAKDFEIMCSEDSMMDCLSPLDYDFPIDADMVDTLIQLSVEELVRFFNTEGQEDFTTNSRDDAAKDRQ